MISVGLQFYPFSKMVRLPQWAAMTLLIVTLTGCSRKEVIDSSLDVAATIGRRTITASQLQAEARRREAASRPVPDKKSLLDEMIAFEALVDRAYASGLADDPEIRREISTLLVSKLVDREVENQNRTNSVSDELVKAEYDANLPRYTRPAKARLAVLHVEAGKLTSEAKRAETHTRFQNAREKFLAMPVENRKEGLRPGFGALARDFSDDQTTRYRGGDIGWVVENKLEHRLPRAVMETAFKLHLGEVSEIIEAENGLYLVTKTDFEPGFTTPFAQVESSIRQTLLARKNRDVTEGFRQQTIKQTPIRINDAVLAAVELPKTAVIESRSNNIPPSPGVAGVGQLDQKRTP